MVSLAEKRRAAVHLEKVLGVSERRACRILALARSTKRRPSGGPDVELVARIHELSREYSRFGYRKIFFRLKHEGWRVGRETVGVLRRREGLQVPQRQPKRRRRGTSTQEAQSALYANHVWSYDFVSDQTEDGKTLRFLTVIDEYTRRGLWIECARHLTSFDVVRVLELVEVYGAPGLVKSDNGPEFVAKKPRSSNDGKKRRRRKQLDGQAKYLNSRLVSFLWAGHFEVFAVARFHQFDADAMAARVEAEHRRAVAVGVDARCFERQAGGCELA